MIASQILGLAYARYVLGLSEADIAQKTAVAMIGRTIQRYLFEEMP